MRKKLFIGPVFAAALLGIVVTTGCQINKSKTDDGLTGAWRGNVQISSGAYADAKDVKFMYAFNAGGTMTESSNYDAVPPGSPAYGMWRKIGARQYEARYEFFMNMPPASFDELAKGGGWMPDGHGVVTEKIILSADGYTFDSTLKYEFFNPQGKLIPGGGEAISKAERLIF